VSGGPDDKVSLDGATQVSSSRLPLDDIRAEADRPRAATKPPTGGGGTSSATTIGSPAEALEHDEILRTRWFCFIALAIALAGIVSVIVLPGDATASVLALAGGAIAIVAISFLYLRTTHPMAFRKRSTVLGWFIPASCVTTAVPLFGAFSPASLVLVLGIYFTGLGKSWRLAFSVWAVLAGVQGLVAALVISGATRDTGLVRVPNLAVADQIVIQLLVQLVMLATLVTARMSRRTTLVAIGELERAVRVAAQREALLMEAREELERALRAGGGRFSDQTIGSYRLGAVIGRGAMGEVYEAGGPNGVVAIKLLSQASLGNPNHVLRFLRELRTAAALTSLNIVRVIEVGEVPVPYLVMEKLEGQTLAELLRGRKALGPDEVIDMIAQIGAGVTAAAAAGIVHRDLKPQNVFLDHGTWKILDFGVARAIDGGDTLTAGHVVGTPSYMAPEQASGGTVDHATDLYALAAIAYRSLTGLPPFAAGEIAETLYRVVNSRPRRPTDLADLPPEIDLVLAIGLAKDPTRRFEKAADLAGAIAGAFAGDLSPDVFTRGRALEHAGAWSGGAGAKLPTAPRRAVRPR
jgi:serine/threonine-protein kinase